jgi:hypothetical protein
MSPPKNCGLKYRPIANVGGSLGSATFVGIELDLRQGKLVATDMVSK